ncbi:CYTH and CHAD domain-containing protein [Streptomyces sp. OF3]|uniref:CYTH and CHAD domain-containing protein n=1 Tax=Streptomyces alkaliterrae TaxID=2213162 RepID=A0A7W3WNE0_9ACTN|nr:CYTH and CHAD domain-containing protein [Streptomyces alkaliterrae]MBB1255541.1 CYTH and CHAD domain-containing protein [Streptomyces alkaliterrae]
MVSVVRETERKYTAPTGRELPEIPDLTGVAGVAAVHDEGVRTLDARYFDTADLRLAADGVTLRHRTGPGEHGWQLKLPVEPDVREEIRSDEAGEDPETPPAALVALTRSRTRDRPLRPVMRLTTTRAVHTLRDAAGAALAEVVRDAVSAERADDQGSARWSEIEVELAEGSGTDLLDAVGQALLAAGLHRADTPSKLRRALHETGLAPVPAALPDPGPPHTAGDAVLRYLRAQAAELVALDPAVRRGREDSVHRMRVASRRLRSALRTHRALLDRAATEPLVDELGWFAAELGLERDLEVLTARLRERVDTLPAELRPGPVLARLRAHERDRRRPARRAVLAALDSDRWLRLLADLDRLTARPPLLPAAHRPPHKPLRKAVTRDFDRLATRMDQVLRSPEGPERDGAAHAARKAAKRLRYAAETAQLAHGKTAARYARRVRRLQDLLGAHQDAVVTRAALRELAAEADAAGESSFAYGVLYGREERAAADTLAALPDAWRALRAHRRLT